MSKAAGQVWRWRCPLSSRLARIVVALAGALTFAAPGPALATGADAASASVNHIYWTNAATSRGPEGPGIDTVARADLNGGNIDTDLVKAGEFPEAIAVDANHIYWVNDEQGAIARAGLDGVNPNFIHAGAENETGSSVPAGLAVGP